VSPDEPPVPERELHTLDQSNPASQRLPARFSIEVIDGADKGRRFTIDPLMTGPVLVGQSASCAIRLSDRSVSRRHLSLDIVGSELRMTDLESTNGTLVNDIDALEVWLHGGERIRVGSTTMLIERDASPHWVRPKVLRFGRIVGGSPAMLPVHAACADLVLRPDPVLVEGEPGTGKELVAEVLHELGSRAAGPYVTFDRSAHDDPAAALVDALEEARGGTLLIRAVAELGAAEQAVLLPWLTAWRSAPSSDRARGERFDVRLITTSTISIDTEVEAGRFGADTAEAIATARIALPPLRRREGDIAELAKHFYAMFDGPAGGLPDDAIGRFEGRSYPRNVRDLKHAVASFVARTAGPGNEGAAKNLDELVSIELPFSRARELIVERFEQLYVEKMLSKHGGNVSRAAQASGIARRYFQIVKSRYKPAAPPVTATDE
jgi:two-component system, NtrC family, response regulator HydG